MEKEVGVKKPDYFLFLISSMELRINDKIIAVEKEIAITAEASLISHAIINKKI